MTTGNEAAGDDSAQSDAARKDELLALLKRMLSPEDFEYVQSLVAAGLPLTREQMRTLRRELAPPSWQERGRPRLVSAA